MMSLMERLVKVRAYVHEWSIKNDINYAEYMSTMNTLADIEMEIGMNDTSKDKPTEGDSDPLQHWVLAFRADFEFWDTVHWVRVAGSPEQYPYWKHLPKAPKIVRERTV